MSKGLRLSEKHGVNPSLDQCFYCGEAKGVVLFGRMKGDVQAPHEAVIDMKPCDKCAKLMQDGVILVCVRDGETGDDPYRTGMMVAIKDEGIRMAVTPPEFAEEIIRRRFAFVPLKAWTRLGLPTEEPK